MFQYPTAVFVVSPVPTALPGDHLAGEPALRGQHAQTLAHAARRRRAASVSGGGVDRAYWMAGVPAALAKATSLRHEPRFRRLP